MPFRSQAQMRFLYARHPAIAKRWQNEYHQSGKGLPQRIGGKDTPPLHLVKATPTNESNNPLISRPPRLPGNKRDFGMLRPSAAARFTPKNKPYPNQQQSDKESPVQGHSPSYADGHSRILTKELKHPPEHQANVNRVNKRIGF